MTKQSARQDANATSHAMRSGKKKIWLNLRPSCGESESRDSIIHGSDCIGTIDRFDSPMRHSRKTVHEVVGGVDIESGSGCGVRGLGGNDFEDEQKSS
jgi:hypothetical protein